MQAYHLQEAQNSLTFYPERWGLISSIVFNGSEILFQDMLNDTLFDSTKSVRWWIPILFPQAWPILLSESQKLWFLLPQHWVLRQTSWKLKHITENTAEIIFESDATNTEFPFMFEIEMKISLWVNTVQVNYTVINNWDIDFPIAPWLHPYFAIKNKTDLIFGELTEKIQSKRDIWENNGTITVKNARCIELYEESKAFKITSLWILKDFWIWSMKDKNFICIEPVFWDEWSLSQDPYILKSWEYTNFWIEISIEN